MSEAIRLFLHQVISKKGLPFPIEAPNEITVKAMEYARSGKNLETITLEQLANDWDDACGQ